MQPRSLRYKKAGPPITLPSRRKLDELLDQLTVVAARKGPMMVLLKVPDVGEMFLAIGVARSVLSYTPAKPTKKDPPRVSVGEDRSEGVLYFDYCGRRCGYERRRSVRGALAREAFRHFYDTGELTPDVKWETY